MRALSLGMCLAAVLSVGCSASSEAGSGGAGGTAGFGGSGGFSGAAGMSGFGGAGGVAGSGACLTFETQACACGSFPGRAVCSAGVWSSCLCDGAGGTGGTSGMGGGGNMGTAEPLANKNASVMWSWTASPPGGGCRPGHYEGNFDGFYSSSLTFIGFPIPVMGVDLAGMPPLEFDLVAAPGGGEILSVSGGKMRGTANGLFPFAFDIVGELDCATLKFKADLTNGYYEAFGTRIEINGPLIADYDPVTASMVNGHWIVAEPGQPTTPPFPPGWYGGEGAWQASFIRP